LSFYKELDSFSLLPFSCGFYTGHLRIYKHYHNIYVDLSVDRVNLTVSRPFFNNQGNN